MEKIESFKVNHLTLMRGIYVSRKDMHEGRVVATTFDIRMREPNREPAMSPETAHAMEHLAATWLRNSEWRDSVIYWGPMGCMTGSYLILQGDLESADITGMLTKMFEWISEFDGEIPGASPRDCGNWTYMDLQGARDEAGRFLDEVLLNLKEENLKYPEE